MDRKIVYVHLQAGQGVALRKESVDRKNINSGKVSAVLVSLSARRAWIESDSDFSAPATSTGRSPQGERG